MSDTIPSQSRSNLCVMTDGSIADPKLCDKLSEPDTLRGCNNLTMGTHCTGIDGRPIDCGPGGRCGRSVTPAGAWNSWIYQDACECRAGWAWGTKDGELVKGASGLNTAVLLTCEVRKAGRKPQGLVFVVTQGRSGISMWNFGGRVIKWWRWQRHALTHGGLPMRWQRDRAVYLFRGGAAVWAIDN